MITELTHESMDNLCKRDDRLLVCISGGIDSMVMLDILQKGGWNISAAHCNFSLRGKESDGDENFVRETCKLYGVDCHVAKFDTKTYAIENGLNTQIAARELRYNFFFKLKEQFGYDKIVVAHHLDDSIETFFINLFRGTGIKGLSGISRLRGDIIRPMLHVTRKEISEYAKNNNIEYREDSSNRQDHYLRNKIRHHIIPMIENLSPAFKETMDGNLQRLQASREFIDYSIGKIKDEICDNDSIDIEKLNKYPSRDFILFEILQKYNFKKDVVNQLSASIILSNCGKSFLSPTHIAVLEYGKITIYKKSEIQFQNKGTRIVNLEDIKVIPVDNIDFKNHSLYIATLDYDKLHFPLVIRSWRPGDRFQPLGMKGTKTIGDFLTDLKVPLKERDRIEILAEKESGKTVWVIGKRIDDNYKISSKTRKVAVIDYDFQDRM